MTRPIEKLFVMIGAEPNTGWLFGTLKGQDGSFEGSRYATNIPGIFAVGDVRSGSVKRVASAVGEGSVVVADIHRYLAAQRGTRRRVRCDTLGIPGDHRICGRMRKRHRLIIRKPTHGQRFSPRSRSKGVPVRVAELWRYPVKSMAGERLELAKLGESGMHGDRVVQVRNATGRLITSRTHPQLLGFHGRFDDAEGPLVDGVPWRDRQVAGSLEAAIGPGANLVSEESNDRFDVLPLLVATDGAIAAFGYDGRRLRPNIVVAGVQGLAERTWEGRALRVGDVLIGVHSLRGRCVMTTFDPDSLEQDRRVLNKIVEKFDGRLALNCWVIQSGTIRVGDEVEIL